MRELTAIEVEDVNGGIVVAGTIIAIIAAGAGIGLMLAAANGGSCE